MNRYYLVDLGGYGVDPRDVVGATPSLRDASYLCGLDDDPNLFVLEAPAEVDETDLEAIAEGGLVIPLPQGLVEQAATAQMLAGAPLLNLISTTPFSGAGIFEPRPESNPEKPEGPTPVTGEPKPGPDKLPAAAETSTTRPAAPPSEIASALTSAQAALAGGCSCAELLKALSKEGTSEQARALLESEAEAREKFGERAAWVFAADRDLLERLDASTVPGVAEAMLRARAGIRETDVDQAQATVSLAEERVAFEKERVKYAGVVVSYGTEQVEHAKTWRTLAGYGVAVFALATIFAMAVIAVLVEDQISGDGDLSGSSLALIVFALAVFAASPGVLLLLERPLKGVDEWMPGGSTETGETTPEADTAEAPPASPPPTPPTTTTTTTTAA